MVNGNPYHQAQLTRHRCTTAVVATFVAVVYLTYITVAIVSTTDDSVPSASTISATRTVGDRLVARTAVAFGGALSTTALADNDATAIHTSRVLLGPPHLRSVFNVNTPPEYVSILYGHAGGHADDPDAYTDMCSRATVLRGIDAMGVAGQLAPMEVGVVFLVDDILRGRYTEVDFKGLAGDLRSTALARANVTVEVGTVVYSKLQKGACVDLRSIARMHFNVPRHQFVVILSSRAACRQVVVDIELGATVLSIMAADLTLSGLHHAMRNDVWGTLTRASVVTGAKLRCALERYLWESQLAHKETSRASVVYAPPSVTTTDTGLRLVRWMAPLNTQDRGHFEYEVVRYGTPIGCVMSALFSNIQGQRMDDVALAKDDCRVEYAVRSRRSGSGLNAQYWSPREMGIVL